VLLLTATLGLVGASAASAQTVTGGANGTSPLAGIQDDRAIQVNPDARFKTMAEAGARIARIDLRWDFVAGSRPAAAADPNDPAYDWSTYDEVVEAARKYKVQVLFTVWGTPRWAVNEAEFAHGDRSFGDYTYPPQQATDFQDFATAAAARYTPLGVRYWEGWNEPNVPMFLQPQFRKVGTRYVAASPAIYSNLQKAFYRGVKKSNPRALVAGVVTAPAGSGPKGVPTRVTPQNFVKALNAKALRPPMDFVSHHPYPVRQRTDKPTPKGRTYADLYNLDHYTKALDATYLKGKRLWLTEYGFSTSVTKEYTTIVSPAGQALNISDAYARMKRTPRVSMAIYYLLQDHKGWRSGLLAISGAKKPGYTAHQLPLWTRTATSTRTLVGQVRPAVGRTRVTVQTLTKGRWRAAKVVTTSADGSFRVTVASKNRVPTRVVWTGTTRAKTKAKITSRVVNAGGR